jgi:uncharacterized protein YggE
LANSITGKERTMNRFHAILVGAVGVALAGWWLLSGGPLAGQVGKADAGKEPEPRKLHTSGTATVRVKANRARLYLAVETTGSTVKAARAANKKDVETVLAALHGLKIADLKMKSTNVQMDVIQSKEEKITTKLPEILGYRVTYTFTVLVSNDDPQKLAGQASQVLDTALESGANAVQQITFFRDDLTDARRQALTKATADAVANAKALVAGDNRTLTDLINIDGEPQYSQSYNNPMSNTMQPQDPAGGAVSLVAGEVEVTCRVCVTCTFGAGK